MSEPMVLHRCEARGQQVVGGPIVDCQEPGTLTFNHITGKTYWVCARHAEVFAQTSNRSLSTGWEEATMPSVYGPDCAECHCSADRHRLIIDARSDGRFKCTGCSCPNYVGELVGDDEPEKSRPISLDGARVPPNPLSNDGGPADG